MKIKIMAIAATIIASCAITTINAQTAVKFVSAKDNTVANKKVQAKFLKEFPAAENTSWIAGRNGYEARFSNNGIETAVGYNNGGRVNYFIERYAADKLPVSVKEQINNAYKEYDVVNVVEVHSAGQVAYMVNIESKKFRKVIRINNDGMDVYQDVALSF